MIICVDGTGPSDDAVYRRNFAHSFVNRIYNRSTQANHYYFRGPGDAYTDGIIGTFGGRHHVAPQFIFQRILSIQSQIDNEYSHVLGGFSSLDNGEPGSFIPEEQKIYLTGYSRGGAIVIEVAKLLQSRGLSVEAMFLFDAVKRSLGDGMGNTDVIPGNVRNCYHALRNIQQSGSRESFSHTGYLRDSRVAGPPNHYFFTTHGGMGGTPWGSSGVGSGLPYIDEGGSDGLTHVTSMQERIGMLEVERWMWRHLLTHRVVTH